MLKKVFYFISKRYAPRGAKFTFAASGEDVLIAQAIKHFNIQKPTYIDIGAHHPIFGNNTYLLYLQGSAK